MRIRLEKGFWTSWVGLTVLGVTQAPEDEPGSLPGIGNAAFGIGGSLGFAWAGTIVAQGTKAGYQTALIADVYHLMKPGRNFHQGFSYWEWIRGQEVDFYAQAPRQNPAMSAVSAIGLPAGDSNASRSGTRPPASLGVCVNP